jgi:amylosucrase
LRCHDDIGWTFDDADAAQVGIRGYDHRQFLNAFYTGQYPGSFARGIPFQHDTKTGDMRISGTMASLAGLEQAIEQDDQEKKESAVQRIVLLHGIKLSIGGIPLLYMGEEWGLLNDYDFVKDPAKAGDTRWIHRPKMRWDYLEQLDQNGINKRIFESISRLIKLRKRLPALSGLQMQLFDCRNPHVLGYTRTNNGSRLIVLANFSESAQEVSGNALRTAGLARFFEDQISGKTIVTSERISLPPLQIMWLASA